MSWREAPIRRVGRYSVSTSTGWASPCGRFGVHPWDGRPTEKNGWRDTYILTHIPSGLSLASCKDPEILLGIPPLLSSPDWSQATPTDAMRAEWLAAFPLFAQAPSLAVLTP